MPESAAERQRRARRHRTGDHSLCVVGRCEALSGTVRTVQPAISALDTTAPGVGTAENPGSIAGRIEELTREFVKTLPYGLDDPRHLLGELAVELAKRIDEGGAVPAAVGQLRQLLMQLAEAPNGPSGLVDEMRVRHHQRQLDAALAVSG